MPSYNHGTEHDLGHERRRFPIEQGVRYQCVKGSRICTAGVGKTLEIGSREIHFTTQHPLQKGEKVRLAVDWPAMLDNTCPIKLEIFGWVLRSQPGTAAVKIERYEFRTRAATMCAAHLGAP
ncbi:MAG TPA: hypothetical protein VMU80_24745 [Bryobacteraceae bacterium]|nr:hypothetical protein [Bryobacteraceae bacterium]